MKSVIVLGKGELAVQVSEWFRDSPEYDLLSVVPNMPESSWTASLLEWSRKAGVPAIESGKIADIPGSVDLAVSVTYDKIIRADFISRCGKIINIHNGPLPQYRGVNPINWALKNVETTHGVTIHEITTGIDEGPIIAQVSFPIDPEVDEVIDVYKRSLEFGWKLFKETMPRLWNITPKPQDESRARYYSAKDFPKLGERSFFTRAESIEKLKI